MKRNLILTSALVATLTLVGCNNNSTTNTDENTTSSNTSTEVTETTETTETTDDAEISEQETVGGLTDIQSKILTEELLPVAFQTIDAKDFYVFENIADKIEEGFAAQALMNVKFRDVVVVKTSDVEAVKSTLEDYLNSDNLRSFKDGYGGEDNIEAISNAIVNSSGNYVYLIATPNASDIEKELLTALN